ncbi:MAG: hypothetical protein Q9160_000994 [Pyrenula sp. 1 TL-2023]
MSKDRHSVLRSRSQSAQPLSTISRRSSAGGLFSKANVLKHSPSRKHGKSPSGAFEKPLSPTLENESVDEHPLEPPRTQHRPIIRKVSAILASDTHHNRSTSSVIASEANQAPASDASKTSEETVDMIVAPFGNNIRQPPALKPLPGSEYGQLANMAPGPPGTTGGGSQNPNILFQHISDIVSKRISTLDYLRKAHSGKVHWFNTLLFTQTDLQRLPSLQSPRSARRANNYLLLGLSIPTLNDLHATSPYEYLRALNTLLSEFESYQSIHPTDGSGASSLSRARIPQMFKRTTYNKGRRTSNAASEIGAPLTAQSTSSFAVSEGNSINTPSATETFPVPSNASLSSATNSGISVPTDTSLLPGEEYTYLLTPSLPFDPDFYETFATLCDVLIDTYTKILNMIGSPTQATVTVGDVFAKADARLRKVIVAGVVRDFEEGSRGGAKSELAGVGRVVLGGLLGNGG